MHGWLFLKISEQLFGFLNIINLLDSVQTIAKSIISTHCRLIFLLKLIGILNYYLLRACFDNRKTALSLSFLI